MKQIFPTNTKDVSAQAARRSDDVHNRYAMPRCFDTSHQFMEWRRANINTKEKARICEDCTLQHRQQMLSQNRCDPEVWERVVLGPYMQFRVDGT